MPLTKNFWHDLHDTALQNLSICLIIIPRYPLDAYPTMIMEHFESGSMTHMDIPVCLVHMSSILQLWCLWPVSYYLKLFQPISPGWLKLSNTFVNFNINGKIVCDT